MFINLPFKDNIKKLLRPLRFNWFYMKFYITGSKTRRMLPLRHTLQVPVQ